MAVFGMTRGWLAPALIVAMVAGSAGVAFAQGQQQYDTPLYTTTPAEGLEKNYGLPTFGTPGAEVPRPKAAAPDADQDRMGLDATAPDQKTASGVPDFFAGSTEIALPRPRVPTFGSADMETPTYTTSDGTAVEPSTLGETETSSGDTLTAEKPAVR